MQVKQIHVCVIDDGICENEIDLFRNIQIRDGRVVDFLNVCKSNSHGTGCAKVIEKNAEKDIIISSVSILNGQYKGNVHSLYLALEWCIKNDVDIINLSLGSVFFKDKEILLNIVNRCAEKGIIIVSATCNEGYTTYPASFTNVLGVKAFKENGKNGCAIRYDTNLGFGLFETKGNERISIGNVEKTTNWCNSIAAPHITAEIINIYERGMNVIEIRNMFTDNLLEINCFEIDWVSKAYARNIHELIPAWCVCNIYEEEKELQLVDTIITRSKEDIDIELKSGKNIIYIGKDAPNYTSNEKYIWSGYNRLQQIKLNRTVINGKMEIPVIFIKEKYALKNLYELRRFLRERDYNAYSISHNILYELYGITYVPIPEENIDSNTISNFINNELYYKLGDILLYDISEIDESLAEKNIKMSPDIIIEADEKTISVSSEKEIKKKLDSVEAVGEYILNLLVKG